MADRLTTQSLPRVQETFGDLEKILFGTARGQVKALVGPDLDLVRHWLDSQELPDLQRPILLLDRIERIPSVGKLLDMYVATLADAALRLWPIWYTDTDFARFDKSSIGLHGIHATIHGLTAQDFGVSPLWAQRAVAQALNARAPVLQEFNAADQLHQLSLAVHRHGVVLIVALEDHQASFEQLRAFSQSTIWLAQNGNVAVIVLIPASMAVNPGLDALLYDASYLENCTGQGLVAGHSPGEVALGALAQTAGHPKELAKWLWPLIGRPHPFSPAEQQLAGALAQHSDLASLFAFNQPVATVRGTRYIADLLWHEGRVIVEIDGYRFHSDETAFARDRHRDYELTLSGYLILRMPHNEVMADVARAVTKIRDMVKFRRDSQTVRN
ncbi:MAG: endonuclease domain-containing protein [Rhodomicrobium sp.]